VQRIANLGGAWRKNLSSAGQWVVVDKGFDNEPLRHALTRTDAMGCNPPRSYRKTPRYDSRLLYGRRHTVKNFFARLKRPRRIFGYYQKLAVTFLGILLPTSYGRRGPSRQQTLKDCLQCLRMFRRLRSLNMNHDVKVHAVIEGNQARYRLDVDVHKGGTATVEARIVIPINSQNALYTMLLRLKEAAEDQTFLLADEIETEIASLDLMLNFGGGEKRRIRRLFMGDGGLITIDLG